MIRIRRLSLQMIDIKVFLLGMICVCYLSPTVLRTIGTVGTVALIGFYLLLEINNLLHASIFEKITMLLIAFYIALLLIYSFLGMSDKGAGQTSSVLFMLGYFLIVPVRKTLSRKHCVFLVVICVLTILVTMLQNYALWIRMGHRITQQWWKIGVREVVNTQYVHAIVLFSGVMFSLFLVKKGSAVRYLYLAIVVVCFVFNIAVSQRMIALILSIVMVMLLSFANGEVTRGKIVRYLVFAVVFLFFVIEYQLVLGWLADVVGSDRLRRRINTISTLITMKSLTDLEDGSMATRLRLIGVSIRTVFSSIPNFFFGVGDKTDNSLVGNHSYFFDEFAKFGVIGGLVSCSIVVRMMKTARNVSTVVRSDPLHKLIDMMFLTMFIRSLIGGILSPPIGTVMFVFLPLVFRLLKEDAKAQGNADAQLEE